MSDTRVELHVTFTVSSDREAGRVAAERAIYVIDYAATHGQLDDCFDFEVTRGSVNGNAWAERWPDKTTAYSGWDDTPDTIAETVQAIIERTDGMSDMSGLEPHVERLAEYVRDLAKVVYALVPKDA